MKIAVSVLSHHTGYRLDVLGPGSWTKMMMNVAEDEQKYMMMDVLMSNTKQIENVRSFMCVVGGAAAGILNVTNMKGLYVFLALYLAVVLGIGIKVGFDFMNYTNKPGVVSFAMADLSKHGLSFVLFWTLGHALVYIY
jgi:ER membrane protein complex subunit 6